MSEIVRTGRQPVRELMNSVETAFSQHTGIERRRVVSRKGMEEYLMEWIGTDGKKYYQPVILEDLGGNSLKGTKWRVFMYVPKHLLL